MKIGGVEAENLTVVELESDIAQLQKLVVKKRQEAVWGAQQSQQPMQVTTPLPATWRTTGVWELRQFIREDGVLVLQTNHNGTWCNVPVVLEREQKQRAAEQSTKLQNEAWR